MWIDGLDLDSRDGQIAALYRLGHFSVSPPDKLLLQLGDFERAVKSLQGFCGLTNVGRDGSVDVQQLDVDGDFGKWTKRSLQSRFCGCPDIAPKLEAGGLPKWGKKKVTIWHDMEQLRNVSFAEAKDVYIEAAEMWNDVCGIEHEWANTTPDIFAHARRIDGAGNVLAWSYLPNSSNYLGTIEQRYDTGDNWSGNRLRTLFRPTACHELGHGDGLSHSPTPSNIMYPNMNGTQQPAAGDISQMVARYGKPNGGQDRPIINYFRSDLETVKVGEVYRIMWDVDGADNIQFQGRSVDSTDHVDMSQPKSGLYTHTLTASNTFGVVNAQVSVNVTSDTPGDAVKYGDIVTITNDEFSISGKLTRKA